MPIRCDDLDCPKTLRTKLRRRADPDGLVVFEGPNGDRIRPALHEACRTGNVRATEMLIEAGATLDLIHDSDSQWTALAFAGIWGDNHCHHDKFECMQLLLHHGADPNGVFRLREIGVTPDRWVTPLHYAMWEAKPKVVKLLLSYKADPAKRTEGVGVPSCMQPDGDKPWGEIEDIIVCTRLLKEALDEQKPANKRTPRRRGRSQPLAITDQSDSTVGASSPAAVQHALTPQTAAEDRRRNRRGLLQLREGADDEPPAAPAAITAEAISAYQAALRQANKEIKRKKQAKRVRAEAAATAAAMRAIL